jgi:hypothetical protein
MSKRSYLWRQAQICLSRARVTGDPILKELYEDMAVDFAHNAAREQDLEIRSQEISEARESREDQAC